MRVGEDRVVAERSAIETTERPRPVGVFAAALALVVIIGVSVALPAYSLALAKGLLPTIATQDFPLKYKTLTLQRAALADDQILVMYGASQLYCCGAQFLAIYAFGQAPTGFAVYGVGTGSIGELEFFQDFAALGSSLKGKKIVVIEDPEGFGRQAGQRPNVVAGLASPELTELFAFDAPISLALRRDGARRLLANPPALVNQPLTQLALSLLATDTPAGLLGYALLYPAGRIDSWFSQERDAYQTATYLETATKNPPGRGVVGEPGGWFQLLADATAQTNRDMGGNAFGLDPTVYRADSSQAWFQQAVTQFCAHESGRDAPIVGPAATWTSVHLTSATWDDYDIELRVLNEVGARPLIVFEPFIGTLYDYSNVPLRARQAFYEKFAAVTSAHQTPFVSFAENDEDRGFLVDQYAHPSTRGWLYIDRAIDAFWQDRTTPEIQTEIANLNLVAPPLPPAAPATYCSARQF